MMQHAIPHTSQQESSWL